MEDQPNGAFSTIDPRIQLVWDSTCLSILMACPGKYQEYMLNNWRPDGTATPLTFGLHYHKAIETYHRARAKGADFVEAQRLAVKTAFEISGERDEDGLWHPWASEDSNRNLDTLIRSIVWYLEHFKDDPLKTVVLSDGSPAVELSFQFQLPEISPTGEHYWFSGHLDRLVEFNDQIWVSDLKTTTRPLGGSYFDSYTPDNQMSLYTFASGIAYKAEAQGVIVDAIQVQATQSKFMRGFVQRSQAQLDEWYQHAIFWIHLAGQFAISGRWPWNLTACNNFGKCPFRDVHAQAPHMREGYFNSGYHKEVWDPTKPRGVEE